jgi:hypothetical protein
MYLLANEVLDTDGNVKEGRKSALMNGRRSGA